MDELLAERQEVRLPIARGRCSTARRAAPLLALPVILVHLAGTVGVYLHFALVQHRRCPQHGELIHAEKGEQAPAARPIRSATSDPAAEQGDGPARDSHDPCNLTMALRQRAVEPRPELAGTSEPACQLELAPTEDSPSLAGRTGYRVAPKTSPPRA